MDTPGSVGDDCVVPTDDQLVTEEPVNVAEPSPDLSFIALPAAPTTSLEHFKQKGLDMASDSVAPSTKKQV